jgi:hypothetical protein
MEAVPDYEPAQCFHKTSIPGGRSVLVSNGVPDYKPKTKNDPRIERDGKRAAQEEAERIRWLLAINPNTPPPVLEHLARDAQSRLLERVAENPRTHVTTLARLSMHTDSQVRASVAENPNISLKTTWRLAKDDSPDVRHRMAESYTVPLAVLRVLAEDENPYVSCRAKATIQRILDEVHSLRTA